MEGKEAATRQVVEVAYGLIEGYAREVGNGRMRLEEAQESAKASIKTLRYSEFFRMKGIG